MNKTKQFVLMEICCTQDCTEYNGGWKVSESDSRSDLQAMAKEKQPGDCPGCGEQLIFEIWENPEDRSLFKDIKVEP